MCLWPEKTDGGTSKIHSFMSLYSDLFLQCLLHQVRFTVKKWMSVALQRQNIDEKLFNYILWH